MKALNYQDVLLKHKQCIVDSRSECDISTVIANKKVTCPVFCSNMPSVLTKNICKIFDEAGWFHVYHRLGGMSDIKDYIWWANKNNLNFVSLSLGIKIQDELILEWLLQNKKFRIDAITIDVAFSWQKNVEKMIKFIKDKFPQAYLIVGNGDSPEWIQWLENLGADCAKINIGVSSSCRTKEYTGFGSTTITDLQKCKAAAKNIKILSDGGITACKTGEPAIGDVAKAIKFGADYIQSGFLFSQCLDSPSIKTGYYGNASSRVKSQLNHIEGTTINVQTNGLTIKEQIKLIEDSLRSSVSYSGGNKLEDLRQVDYITI